MPETNAVKIERRLRMSLVGDNDGMREAMRDDLVTFQLDGKVLVFVVNMALSEHTFDLADWRSELEERDGLKSVPNKAWVGKDRTIFAMTIGSDLAMLIFRPT